MVVMAATTHAVSIAAVGEGQAVKYALAHQHFYRTVHGGTPHLRVNLSQFLPKLLDCEIGSARRELRQPLGNKATCAGSYAALRYRRAQEYDQRLLASGRL